MPFVTVEIVGASDEPTQPLAQALADACSPAFPPEHSEVWVRVRNVAAQNWAITRGKATPPYPVFVYVMREINPVGAALQREVDGVTTAVANVTGRPVDSVIVEFEPSAVGRLAFGGNLLE